MWVLKLIPTLFKFKQSATLDGDDRNDREDREDREDRNDREDKAKIRRRHHSPIIPIFPIIPINSTSISKKNFLLELYITKETDSG